MFQRVEYLLFQAFKTDKSYIVQLSVAVYEFGDYSPKVLKLTEQPVYIHCSRHNALMDYSLRRTYHLQRRGVSDPRSYKGFLLPQSVHLLIGLSQPLFQFGYPVRLFFAFAQRRSDLLRGGRAYPSSCSEKRFSGRIVFFKEIQRRFGSGDLSVQFGGTLPDLVRREQAFELTPGQSALLIREFDRSEIHESGHYGFFLSVKTDHGDLVHFNNSHLDPLSFPR